MALFTIAKIYVTIKYITPYIICRSVSVFCEQLMLENFSENLRR